MAKNKVPRKAHKPVPAGWVTYEAKTFEYSQEDVDCMTLNAYYRVLAMKDGIGVNADRVTLKIRLLVGRYLLKLFDGAENNTLIDDALEILKKAFDHEKKVMRIFTTNEMETLSNAVSFVHSLCDHCSLWEQALAYKYAEDQCIPGADKWEYVLVQQDVMQRAI